MRAIGIVYECRFNFFAAGRHWSATGRVGMAFCIVARPQVRGPGTRLQCALMHTHCRAELHADTHVVDRPGKACSRVGGVCGVQFSTVDDLAMKEREIQELQAEKEWMADRHSQELGELLMRIQRWVRVRKEGMGREGERKSQGQSGRVRDGDMLLERKARARFKRRYL